MKREETRGHASAHHGLAQASQFACDRAHQESASANESQLAHASSNFSTPSVYHHQQRPLGLSPPVPGAPVGRGVGGEMGFGVGAGTGGSRSSPPPVDEHHDNPQFPHCSAFSAHQVPGASIQSHVGACCQRNSHSRRPQTLVHEQGTLSARRVTTVIAMATGARSVCICQLVFAWKTEPNEPE